MSKEEEIKTIRVLSFSGKEADWDEWSEKFKGIAAERGYLDVMLGKVSPPKSTYDIEKKNRTGDFVNSEAERKSMLAARKANNKGYRDLQLSTTGLSFTLVKLAKTKDLEDGDLKKAWDHLCDEFEPTEQEDKIELLLEFQQNKLDDAKTNVTEWIASLKEQQLRLGLLQHEITDEFLKTHILSSLPKEYDDLVDNAKITNRSASGLSLASGKTGSNTVRGSAYCFPFTVCPSAPCKLGIPIIVIVRRPRAWWPNGWAWRRTAGRWPSSRVSAVPNGCSPTPIRPCANGPMMA